MIKASFSFIKQSLPTIVKVKALAAVVFVIFSIQPAAALDDQSLKICEALIEDLKKQDHLSFVRNGRSYTASRAASHLARKLDYLKDDLQSVEQFISEAASKSSLTGIPYEVIFEDGSSMAAGEFLRARLETLNLKP